MPQIIMSNCAQSRQCQLIIQTDDPNRTRKNVTKNGHVDNSQQIPKYDNANYQVMSHTADYGQVKYRLMIFQYSEILKYKILKHQFMAHR